MDLVGPRYLKGDGRFYSLNLIDLPTRWVHVHLIRNKTAQAILEGIIHFWKHFGIQDCLQMDNELVYRGSNRHPRSLGLILRFLLSQNVAPVFIPHAEPWRNGVIEKFNDNFDKRFFRVQIFDNFQAMKQEAVHFEAFHNQNHRYSAISGKTPQEMLDLLGPFPRLSKNFQCTSRPPLETGSIFLIRFIRSDLKVSILGQSFTVKKELVYSYIVAEINIDLHSLIIRQDNKIHHVFEFYMPVDW